MDSHPFQFDHAMRVRLVAGEGALDQLGPLARELTDRCVMIVTDAGIRAAGHLDRAVAGLRDAGLESVVFDQVIENPTTDTVSACAAAIGGREVGLFVGLGGGSSLDTAKGCNFIHTNGGSMHDYRGKNRAARPMLPMIAIPTTAGTGSECQSFALISDAQTHEKMACGDRKALPAVAILDPMLTLTQPRTVAACTGADAISHAIESLVTRAGNAMSQMLATEAFRLLTDSFETVLESPDDVDARASMQLGAALAGAAIEASMLGAAHAAANPLTATLGVVHGAAVAAVLPHVMHLNQEAPHARRHYARLARQVQLTQARDDAVATAALIERVRHLLTAAPLPPLPEPSSSDEALLNKLASDAATQWTGTFNPRPLTQDDFVRIYRQTFCAGVCT